MKCDQAQQAYQYLLKGKYEKAQEFYELAIENEPTETNYYWYLGLVFLLQGSETDAQTIWLSVMMEATPEEEEIWNEELIKILETEAIRQESLSNLKLSWIIRQYLQEFNPDNLKNIFSLLDLSLNLELNDDCESIIKDIIEKFSSDFSYEVEEQLLIKILVKILNKFYQNQVAINFKNLCIKIAKVNQSFQSILTNKMLDLFREKTSNTNTLVHFAEIIIEFQPNNFSILINLIHLYQKQLCYQKSEEIAYKLLDLSHNNILDQLQVFCALLKSLLLKGNGFDEAKKIYPEFENIRNNLIKTNININSISNFNIIDHVNNLIGILFLDLYLSDNPQKNHNFRNKFGKYFQEQIKAYFAKDLKQYKQKEKQFNNISQTRKLRIGYLSSSFRRHSVGYLSRWLFPYHNTGKFEIYAYSLSVQDDFVQYFIANHSIFRKIDPTSKISEIFKIIYEDNIDILVDLDSITDSTICNVMILKPAPISVTWLGSDASGLPAIDYFMADGFVLPEDAQDYYTQKIWRLPNSYIAIDGFEVNTPTLKRKDLNIPTDSIIYFSSQTGYKRNPHNIRLQLKILKQVPNSYFLIKGLYTKKESIQEIFYKIATEENVDIKRLYFLDDVPHEATHRGNLAIADVVLDTYPYNGATTTLETLWMEIPIVTRVGEQFAARNSYTMMKNAGLTEGIAWSDEEYIEWGIKLGKDENLRQQIAWKLKKSKQKSPLWNGEQFTREMEKAYTKMWEIYINS